MSPNLKQLWNVAPSKSPLANENPLPKCKLGNSCLEDFADIWNFPWHNREIGRMVHAWFMAMLSSTRIKRTWVPCRVLQKIERSRGHLRQCKAMPSMASLQVDINLSANKPHHIFSEDQTISPVVKELAKHSAMSVDLALVRMQPIAPDTADEAVVSRKRASDYTTSPLPACCSPYTSPCWKPDSDICPETISHGDCCWDRAKLCYCGCAYPMPADGCCCDHANVSGTPPTWTSTLVLAMKPLLPVKNCFLNLYPI